MALITVLLVFALATIMMTAMLRSSYIGIRRTGNLVDTVQARYYAYGAEELARSVLTQDAASPQEEAVDSLGETWAQEGMSFEIEDGVLELEISDEAGRFNLNNLIDDKGKTVPDAVAVFGRLLSDLGLDSRIAEIAADCADADRETARGGNEEASWGMAPIANRPFADSSELRRIPGLDSESWQKLAEFVTVLPENTLLNLNTAAEPVLKAYAVEGASRDVEQFVHSRDVQPLRNVQDPVVSRLFGERANAMDVKSEYFRARAHAKFRSRHARIETLFRRSASDAKISVLGRSDASRI